MRWAKLITAVFFVIGLALAAAYAMRNNLVLGLANQKLAPFGVSADCAELEIDRNFNLTFEHLCLKHPLVDAKLNNLVINWQWPRQGASPFSYQINHIALEQVQAIGTGALTDLNRSPSERYSPQQFHQTMKGFTALLVPLPISVNHFEYQPFNQSVKYPGELTLAPNHLALTMLNQQSAPLIQLKVEQTQVGLAGEIKTDFANIKTFITHHGIELPPQADISGQLETHFAWRQNLFNAGNTINDLKLQYQTTMVQGNMQWSTTLKDDLMTADFHGLEPVSIQLDDTQSIAQLAKRQLPEQALDILKLNPAQGLQIHPKGKLILDFSANTLALTDVEINNQNKTLPWQLLLTQVTTDLSFDNIEVAHHSQITAKLPQLAPYTQNPIELVSKGVISKSPKQIKLQWQTPATLNLKQLKHLDYSAQQITVDWQGDITIEKDRQPIFDMAVNSQIKHLLAKKMAKASAATVKAELKGSFEDINLQGQLSADEVALSYFKITGNPAQPNIELNGKEISIPNTMAMILYKPVEIQLLDGTMDYHLAGRLSDFENPLNNLLALDLAISSVSGTVKKTWLQDVYYQQKFNFKDGDITSLPAKDNFKIALVETGTNITELKMTTSVNRIQQRFSLALENVSGKAFDGTFAMDKFQWPSVPEKASLLSLSTIDLEKLVALEKQEGIVVTGRLSGQLPLYFQQNAVTINDGRLYNEGNGIIRIKDNPAVARLKQEQSTLKLAFDALENLHYHSLTSDVTMTEDGQMLMETAIKGHNPDIDNEVNFNLNLDYDLLGLIQSLMIADTLEQQLSEKVNSEKEQP